MTKFFLLSIAAILFCSTGFATIFRINSSLTTNAGQKIYKTINEANNASTVLAGDTLMIEGSALQYDNASLTKRLVLIGPGYFLTQNPQTQASPLQAVVGEIDLGATASGSVLIGLTFANSPYYNVPYIYANNIVIMRCYIPNPIQIKGNVNNIQIVQNYFALSALEISPYYNTFTQLSLRNNFIGNAIDITSDNAYPRIFSSVENNVFKGNVTLTTSIFRSNVVATSSSTVAVTSTNTQNNLVRNTSQLPATNGNIVYDSASLFVGPTGNSTDGQYKLKTSSPYLTAGYSGTQPGVFGGSQVYVLSGMPPIPSIFEFTAEGIANKQTGLPISIKVKANQ